MVSSREPSQVVKKNCVRYTCIIVLTLGLFEHGKCTDEHQQNGSLNEFVTSGFNINMWDSGNNSMEDTTSGRANESAILDDLVKQILESSFSAETNESILINSTSSGFARDRRYPKSVVDKSSSDESPQVSMQLVSDTFPEPTTTDQSQAEFMEANAYEDDRHIPYDVVQPLNVPSVEIENRNDSEDDQHVKRMVDPKQQQAEVDQTSNLTISILRQPDPDQSTQEPSAANQSSSRASNQARAMGRSSFSQISRPPYATYDHQIQPTRPTLSHSQQHELSSRLGESNATSGAGREEKPNLAQSISKISSNLAANEEQQPPSGEDIHLERLAAAEKEKEKERERVQQQQQTMADQVTRLSPINQPIELSPSPSPPGDSNANKIHNLLAPFKQSPTSGDKYNSLPSMYFNSIQDLMGNSPSDNYQRNYQSDHRAQLGTHLDAEPPVEYQRNSGTHPASLVNITGPLVPPLSATNAMEAALAAEGAKIGLIHQASGFSRPKGPSASLSGDSVSNPKRSTALSTNPVTEQSLSYTSSKPLEDRLEEERSRADGSSYLSTVSARNPQLATHTHQASGFRSPYNNGLTTGLPHPLSYLNSPQSGALTPNLGTSTGNKYSLTSAGSTMRPLTGPSGSGNSSTTNGFITSSSSSAAAAAAAAQLAEGMIVPSTSSSIAASSSSPSASSPAASTSTSTISSISSSALSQSTGASSIVSSGGASPQMQQQQSSQQQQSGLNKRIFNLTRVEHISAECSNDLIRTLIIFNGTFKGIIYSSGYVRDPGCLYINGTGKTRYDFSIRLNQCGTLGRQEVHPGSANSDFRRRDQVMWNTLSIQYNPIIEQEWDEHFRVSCEYGSDFWKTISFNPFNVETNTGSPVVFTVDPPQCNMEILRGHGMVGQRQEASSGPVTVGDPLTLLIHMRSERAGYDILVKNCVAHNGGTQKMALIDQNGCVVNERYLSPFRGSFSGDDYKHVTLYSYLKAFRFTGSPVLYLECEIHMCQSSCPPQMCYWRRLSKRSTNSSSDQDDFVTTDQFNDDGEHDDQDEDERAEHADGDYKDQRLAGKSISSMLGANPERRLGMPGRRKARKLSSGAKEPLSGNMTLYRALEVRQERDSKQAAPYSLSQQHPADASLDDELPDELGRSEFRCFRRGQVYGFFLTAVSILLAALGVTLGCCWRASSLKRRLDECRLGKMLAAVAASSSSGKPNCNYRPAGSIYSLASSSSSAGECAGNLGTPGAHRPSYLAGKAPAWDVANQPTSRYKDRP